MIVYLCIWLFVYTNSCSYCNQICFTFRSTNDRYVCLAVLEIKSFLAEISDQTKNLQLEQSIVSLSTTSIRQLEQDPAMFPFTNRRVGNLGECVMEYTFRYRTYKLRPQESSAREDTVTMTCQCLRAIVRRPNPSCRFKHLYLTIYFAIRGINKNSRFLRESGFILHCDIVQDPLICIANVASNLQKYTILPISLVIYIPDKNRKNWKNGRMKEWNAMRYYYIQN